MADDIMPEEAVRRRRLGIQNRELDAKLRSMREASPGVMEEAEARAAETQRRNAERVQAQRDRQRAAQEKFQAEERARASRAPTAPSAGSMPSEAPAQTSRPSPRAAAPSAGAGAGVLRGAAGAMMGVPGLLGGAAAYGRGRLRDAALSDYEEEGRRALQERRAARNPRPTMEPGARAEAPPLSTRNMEAGEGSTDAEADRSRFETRGYAEPEYTSASRTNTPSRPRQPARGPSESDRLNAIVLRLQRGEKPVTETEKRLADAMGIAYRKGGMVKPKGHNMREEGMEMKGGRYRGGMKEEMAEMMPMRKKSAAPMMKKGGAVKAPAKKMKSGGKVAPKKMMKGGMTAKPKKKMMGGGKAMYAKGGMTRGCK